MEFSVEFIYALWVSMFYELKAKVASFLENKRAVTPVVTALIGLMVTIYIGIIVIISLINSVKPDTTWSLAANSTWTTLKNNTWIAFALLAIVPIVIGAVAILGYLRFGGK